MIRKDFINGGFPINKRNPVFTFMKDGNVKISYNRHDLKRSLEGDVLKCFGVWPGKINTDCFPLDPQAYAIGPPEKYKEIDDAWDVTVMYNKETDEFEKVSYMINQDDGTALEVVSSDKPLQEYILKIGLQHKRIFR